MSATDHNQIRSALSFVPANNRDTWLRMGMAIKAEIGEDGFEIWSLWSQGDETYNERDARSVWRSISPNGKVTVGTLYHEAKRNGWHGGSTNGNAQYSDRRPVEQRAALQTNDTERSERQREAAVRAAQLWNVAQPAADHPYLVRKGVRPHGVRVHSGCLLIREMDCAGALIVPLRDSSGDLHSLEFVSPAGEKRYLPSGRVSGNYHGIGKPEGILVIAEGYATAASIREATGHAVACAFNAGNLTSVAKALRAKLPDIQIVIAADNDVGERVNVGLESAEEAARAVGGLVALAELEGRKADFNDVAQTLGSEAVRAAIAGAASPSRVRESQGSPEPQEWPPIEPLPEGLPPVVAFDYELLPPILRRRVEDIAERMQCPPDFPAIAIMVMLSSLVGRRCGIAPKRADDWIVVPNLWGMAVGRPGIMKSPPLTEVMRPLQVLQVRAKDNYNSAQADYQAGALVAAEAERVAKDSIRKLLKDGKTGDAHDLAHEALERDVTEPVCKRFVVNDSTVEKLGEILNQNPLGVLLFRDELNGFFRTLERQGHEADRAFYLESWNGDNSFTYDRIGRGTLHIAGACLSILGGIQPGPLADILRGLRGSGDDGLLQRFQLAVWPDVSTDWQNVDREPDHEARDAVQTIIERLDRMVPESAEPGVIPAVRFDENAQALFDSWREVLERRLRSDSEHAMLEAHLAKYRSLVPSLALLIHLAEADHGPVELLPLERAIAWAEYLESHARRIYAPAISPDMDAARLLARRIRRGEVGDAFGLKGVYNNGWSGLATRDEVAAAVAVLIDHDWLRAVIEPTAGRTRTVYHINPGVPRARP